MQYKAAGWNGALRRVWSQNVHFVLTGATFFAGASFASTNGVTIVRSSDTGKAALPNILFVAVDDLNAWIGPMHPKAKVVTPNMDRLAAESMLFINAHCASPSCHPSRVATMTGRSPLKTGITQNIKNAPGYPSWRLSSVLKNAETLPEFFSRMGYSVKGGGKIFHGAQYEKEEENDPAIWDDFYPSKNRQIPEQPVPPFDYFKKNKSEGRPAGHFDWTPLDVADKDMSDYKVVDWALGELRAEHNKPFFLAVGMFRPHVPFQVPKKYYDLYPDEKLTVPPGYPEGVSAPYAVTTDAVVGKWGFDEYHWADKTGNLKNAMRGYLAGVTFCDAMLGRLMDGLRDSRYADNTIVVLWGDNGYHLAEKERFEKFTLWKESTHIPLLIKVPGMTVPGSVCSRPVSLLDMYPTLVDLAGSEPSPQLDGVSLIPWLEHPDLPKETPAVIVGPEPGSWAVVSERYRYIHYFNGIEELYDLRKDPAEQQDLSGDAAFNHVKEYFKNRTPRQSRFSPPHCGSLK
jgi:arylsulfatase A-like enzyme